MKNQWKLLWDHWYSPLSLSDLPASARIELCIPIFLLPEGSLTPGSRLLLSAALCISVPDFSIRWKTARRRNFTQWGSHSPKWTDSHYFLHNPHLELVLNFSDQEEIWRQLFQITSSLGCFYFLAFIALGFFFLKKKKKRPLSKMICFRLNKTLIQIQIKAFENTEKR